MEGEHLSTLAKLDLTVFIHTTVHRISKIFEMAVSRVIPCLDHVDPIGVFNVCPI
jgi:precorrin-4 methylase